MFLPDVNVLVYAHREESPNHLAYLRWLENLISGTQVYGSADLILSGFLRIVTHPRIFDPPSSYEHALAFVEEIRGQTNCMIIRPDARHWEIFCRLCQESNVKGSLISDAYLAALAIESGCTWISTDRDFGRFRGLTWHHPLELPT
jgi:toxin-antitoxin system PIN domain toxin